MSYVWHRVVTWNGPDGGPVYENVIVLAWFPDGAVVVPYAETQPWLGSSPEFLPLGELVFGRKDPPDVEPT